MERNLCHESGCPDLCCINRWNRFSPQEIADVFPRAIRLPWDEEVKYLPAGVYVMGEEGRDGKCRVFIRGRCPNNTNGCTAPHKPFVCTNTPFAGGECKVYRKEKGLPPIEAIQELG